MIRLFYAAWDAFPPWRLDVDELFVRQLPLLDLEVSWSLRREKPGPCGKEAYCSQTFYLPLRVSLGGRVGDSINRIIRYGCELVLFVRLLVWRRYDIIQVRDRRYFFALLGWIVARIRGGKFVYWCSYPFPEHIVETASRRRGALAFLLRIRGRVAHWYVYQVIMRVADHVFVQSDQMLSDISSYGIPKDRMTPVPMGASPRVLSLAYKTASRKIQKSKIVYLGTLARVRRLSMVIEAFQLVQKKVPDAQLIIVGEGDHPGERAALEGLVKQYRLEERVVFTGFVPMEEAWSHAASAEVCLSPIFPSFVLRSASPTKLIEYMALGRPVVANDHPEQTSILRQSGAGMTVPWGAPHFAEAILGLLSDSEKAADFGARGRAWVSGNRTYEKLASFVMQRYKDIVSS